MVSFVCYYCDQTLKKKQLQTHQYSCGRPCQFICIDCRTTFVGGDHVNHTSCMTEKDKYWGQYKNGVPQKKQKQNPQQQQQQQQKQQTPSTTKATEEKKVEEKVEKKEEVKQEKKENDKVFLGWKKEIRQLLKQTPKMKLKRMRKQLVEKYVEANESVEKSDAEGIFDDKIKNKKYSISADNKFVSFAQ